MEESGNSSVETIEALEGYVSQSCDTATYLMDIGEHSDADKVLEECVLILKSDMQSNYPSLLYKAHYIQAQLQNVKGNHDNSLVYLRQAIAMAEQQEQMDNDVLSCMPAETYLNAAIAFQFGERFSEALESAQGANKAAQRAIRALSEIQQQPKNFQDMKPDEAQNQMMVQLDIQIQTYLIQGQIYEKMNRFEDSLRIIQDGRQILEQHFGPQHPLMSDFAQVQQQVQMQVNPTQIDPNKQNTGFDQEVSVDRENISMLLDKRSDLMKRGRVKRVYYETKEEVQTEDMRGELADLEELEDQQERSINSCVQTQSGWMQRQQLMAMRSQQDEQFRMMEMLISTQRSSQVHCNHPKVFVPVQQNIPLQNVPQMQDSSSDVSSSSQSSSDTKQTTEPTVQTPRVPTDPTPEPSEQSVILSSKSSDSDSFHNVSEEMEQHKNYLSFSSQSSQEAPPAFIEIQHEPIHIEEKKQVRQAGRYNTFKEKNFKTDIYVVKKKDPEPDLPVVVEENIIPGLPNKPPSPVVIQPIVPKPKEAPKIIVEPTEIPSKQNYWLIDLSLVIKIQSRIRRYLRIRRIKRDQEGRICLPFYIRNGLVRFSIVISKVIVEHTRTTTRKQKFETTEMETKNGKWETTKHAETEELDTDINKRQRKMIMYHVQVDAINVEDFYQYECSQCLVSVLDFPADFPFLIEYMRESLKFSYLEKTRSYKIEFKKLEWSRREDINQEIRELMAYVMNRNQYLNLNHQDSQPSNLDNMSNISINDTVSVRSTNHEIDYEYVRRQIKEYEKDGHDLDAMRLKIQWEARQLMEQRAIKSTEVKSIVKRHVRKEREEDWKDYIRLNELKRYIPVTYAKKPNLETIVRVQSLVRGFLARRRKHNQKKTTWNLIFEFVVHQNENYYQVRVFSAPKQEFNKIEYPYQVVVTRYMKTQDTCKLRLAELPYASDTCKEDMIDSIEIVTNQDDIKNIREIFFKKLAIQEIEESQIIGNEGDDEQLINDWVAPKGYGTFKICVFKMPPSLTITLSLENKKGKNQDLQLYYIDVSYQPDHDHKSNDYLKLNQLPTSMPYMVYFIKEHLNVNFTEDKMAIDYLSFSPFEHQQFEKQAAKLVSDKKNEVIELKKQKSLKVKEKLFQVLQNQAIEYNQVDDRVNEEFNLQRGKNTYIVQILANVEERGRIIPWQVMVYRSDDSTDTDYINLYKLQFITSQVLRNQVEKFLLIEIDEETNMIQYIALTDVIQDIGKSETEKTESEEQESDDQPQELVRFTIREDGIRYRRATVSVWKVIVEHTVKKKISTTETKTKKVEVQRRATGAMGLLPEMEERLNVEVKESFKLWQANATNVQKRITQEKIDQMVKANFSHRKVVMAKMLELYNTYDANSNSSLDYEEFKTYITHENAKQKKEGIWVDERLQKIQELYAIADSITPEDEGVSFADFAIMMNTYTKKLMQMMNDSEQDLELASGRQSLASSRIDESEQKVEVNEKVEEEVLTQERMLAYQIVVQNDFIEANTYQKIIFDLPPEQNLVTAFRSNLEILWNGTYSAIPDDGSEKAVDKIDAISYKSIVYGKRVGNQQSNWEEKSNLIVNSIFYRLLQADNPASVDSPFIKIMAYPAPGGQVNVNVIKGQLELSLQQVWNLMCKNSKEDPAMLDLADVCEKLSYLKMMREYEILIQKCCTVQLSGPILIDNNTFNAQRYGFDASQALTDVKALRATALIQRAIRRFIIKIRHARLFRTPGYALSSGVFKSLSFYLVFMFKASYDQKDITLTIKELSDQGQKVLMQQHRVSDAAVKSAENEYKYPKYYKLQAVQKKFEDLLKNRTGELYGEGNTGLNHSWKQMLGDIIKEDF